MVKVFIVDDELLMRQGLRHVLDWEAEGYEIVGEAANGTDALSLVEEKKPHIVISDIVMPLMDGLDFTDVLHMRFPQIQIIILSGYDNFEYVRHTLINGVVDYILKPTLNPEELRTVLSKAVERIPGVWLEFRSVAPSTEQLLEECLLGKISKEGWVCLEEKLSAPFYCLFVVCLERDSTRELYELIYQKIKRELAGWEQLDAHMAAVKERQLCILIGYEVLQKNKIWRYVQQLNVQLSLMYERIFSICSQSFGELSELHKVYQTQIVPNEGIGFYLGENNLYLVNGLKEKKEPEKFDFAEYNRCLSKKQYKDALLMIEVYAKNALEAWMDSYRIKNLVKNLVYIFLDTLDLDEEFKEEYRLSYFKRIDAAYYESFYREAMAEVIEELRGLSDGAWVHKNKRMDLILEYIQEHYQEDLKLDMVADVFALNYNYLSGWFNQNMQESFSDYVNRVRIEKACAFLEDAEIAISEVSHMVGYSEHSYFCRVFKKYTGKTPSEWRRDKRI